MNRRVLLGVAISLLVAASLVAVAGIAYRAGVHDDGTRAVGEIVVSEDGERTVVVTDGWRRGWPGFGFGFFFFPLLVVGLILLFGARRGGWGGSGRDRREEFREWHRRVHEEDAARSPGGPPAEA